jgi:hypothetical protein
MVCLCLYIAHICLLLPIEIRPPEASLPFPTLLRPSRRLPAPSHTHLIPMESNTFPLPSECTSFEDYILQVGAEFDEIIASLYVPTCS